MISVYERIYDANRLMVITPACAVTRSEVRSTVHPYKAAVIVLVP